MFGHVLGLLLIFATQVGVVLADQTTPLAGKIAALVGTAITVFFADRATQTRITSTLIAVAGLAVPLLTFALTKMHGGTLAANVATVVIGVFVRLQALYPVQNPNNTFRTGPPSATAAILLGLLFLGSSACKTTPMTPDNFYHAVVTCTIDNTSSTQAGAVVLRCLTSAAGDDYDACLAGLVTAGYWTVDEVACLVRHYAQTSAVRTNAGTADNLDPIIVTNANAWLREKGIMFRAAP